MTFPSSARTHHPPGATRPSKSESAPKSTRSGAILGWGGLAWLPVVASLILSGCGGGPPPPPPLAPVPQSARLYYDDSGGLTDSLRMVVREPARWNEVWQRATARRDNPPPLPDVNFDDDMVLVVAAGRMSPGDRIRVDSVGFEEARKPDGSTEEVMSVVVRTTRACGSFSGDAYPLEIVEVRNYDGRVQFLERSQKPADCRSGLTPAPAGGRRVMDERRAGS